jgi:hypothetical protein
MEIFICSDNPAIKKIFAAAGSKANPLRFIPASDARPAAEGAAGPALFYLDLGSFPGKRLSEARAALERGGRLRWAVVDPDGATDDPAALLQEGALDYLGPKLCRAGVTAARLKQALGAFTEAAPAGAKKTGGRTATAGPAPAKDWASVRPGGEYLFHMMYIELDGHKDAGLRSSESTVGRLIGYFQMAVERAVAPEHGRLWIWTDFSGIVLFPLSVPVDAVTAACLRLMLSRRLVSVDQDIQKLLFSYRMVLIDGATVWRERGRTGTIISDAVNSLSHLGAKFAKPGTFYLAKALHDRLAPGLKKCFVPSGTFEGTALVRMKLPASY